TPPDTAPHAVQVYVSQLRKALGAEVIARRGAGYALDLDPERLDTRRFVRLVGEGREMLSGGDPAAASTLLREGLGLWSGPALADFAYEPFAQTEIARLEELRLDAVEARIDADLTLGRHVELVPELEALTQAQPLREHPRSQLMLALYRSGRQADALAAYRAARDTLVEELGIEPGHELRELEAAILRQDESLLLPDTVPAKPPMQFRRLVTIVFVDIVESMALAQALDAEALGVVLRRYFETVSAALMRHGGTVEKYVGDAVMAAFGIPVSHEDDALRAARAALDVQAGLVALNERLTEVHGVGLEVRIGLEAGEVVVTPSDARQRLVTGGAVGVAARLEQTAAAGEIVVGELAARLIDHAASLEPLGEVEIKGKRDPVSAHRLLELAPVAPAFERRLDAPLVGRKRELASLRRALKRAADGDAVQVALVVGPPGVGKSRLAAELSRRARGVTALWGRCLSYGDGITYWPLRELVRRAPAGEERDEVLAALEAEVPPPAPEIGLAFRQLCECLARERPLVLVFDDVHWAQPTFLEVVEGIADRAEGPILVACLAREELLEDRPDFLEGRANAERIELDPLSAEETEALLDGLGGSALEADQRARIVETAEGNPFFLEQLLALALEGGLVARPLPPTVQALLATRLDRLGPGERAVLERGAVVGKEFALDDVASLLDPEAAPTADAHLRTLSDRGFVRTRGEGAFSFRHGLVQEAVYRSAPKRLRAELHERFADRLERTREDLPELDELVGYHLEQAFDLRSELGESDAPTQEIGVSAGRRLGAAGTRAFKRGDMHAASNLLERATRLLPADEPNRRDLLCDLGLAFYALQDPERAVDLLTRVLTESREPWDARTTARARIELEYIRVRRETGRTADELLDAIDAGIPVFERLGDHRALGRALLLSGWVQGGHRGNHAAWVHAAERALEHYRAAGWPLATCMGEIGIALYWGPTPVAEAIARIEELIDVRSGPQTTATLESFLGGLVAQLGDFERARTLVTSARFTLEDLGLRASALTYAATVLGEIELLVGNAADAEAVLRELCAELEEAEDFSQLASRASELAETLLMQDRLDEAEAWTRIADRYAAVDDTNAQMMWRPIRARIEAKRNAVDRAEQLARQGVELSDTTDDLNRRAKAYAALGTVLEAAGRRDEAGAARQRAIELYVQKGNRIAIERLLAFEGELAGVRT
ncbi:MAG TPA: BTAD domain-containing putative transcriptional regulator, partial [Gaiellaceae bacterium]|nr:BTAD domain-containing putative transcriptional regulator [Gaiellaceae bacterium]